MSVLLRAALAPHPAARARLVRWERLAPLLLPLLAVPAAWHLCMEGLPQETADGLLHLFRLALLDRHVSTGMLYPRWLPELVLGHGYPLFNFYGPAAYYVAEVFRLLGAGIPAALAAAFVTFMLAAGAGMYLLSRDLLRTDRPDAPLVAAVAYMYAPYLLTNVYIRGAVAEVAAQALLPWVFWSTSRLLSAERDRIRYLVLLALTFAGVAVSHNITLLFLPLAWLPYAALVWSGRGRKLRDLVWLVAAPAAAFGLSAFFTLPLVLERRHLAGTAYEIAARYLPENVWTWTNFLDTGLTFEYTFAIPFQLGLVQLALAGVGLVLLPRRDRIWFYWIGLALVSAAAISAPMLPVWLASPTLLIAQFPWRLLSFTSLPLALFAGAIVAAIGPRRSRLVVAGLLIGLIIWANTPRLPEMFGWRGREAPGVVAGVAQFEHDSRALGTSSSSEFMPRWVASLAAGDAPRIAAAPVVTTVESANDFDLVLRTEGSASGPVRLMTSYFPGWRAEVMEAASADTPLPVAPDTAMGLLTVQAPAGAQRLRIAWSPTPIEWAGVAVTLVTLAALALASAVRRARLASLALLGALALGAVTLVARPALEPVRQPLQPVASGAVRWLGHRIRSEPGALWIYPYWFVEQAAPVDFRVRWELRSETRVVAERTTAPYFNTASAADWPPNTLVDDAHFLQLPAGLPAGRYRLAVQVLGTGVAGQPVVIDELTLPGDASAVEPPDREVTGRFADRVALIGYDPPARQDAKTRALDAVVHPGQSLRYTLYWQALDALDTNYHGFVHLVDVAGQKLTGRDQLAGAGILYAPTRMWGLGSVQRDVYALRIPESATTGVYAPMIGLYDFTSLQRLPTGDSSDALRLHPLKVLAASPPEPTQRLGGRFGEFAGLIGYDLAPSAPVLRPGSTLTVTLHFRANAPAAADYTRFLHLHSPTLGMAAQQDSAPASGANPTWAWIPGEHVADRVALTIAPDAAPGAYRLAVGFYDAQAGATRIPAFDAHGAAQPDNMIILTELEVLP